ncbi:ParA family protein [Cereibacter changlensis]|uniref:ParA family protein n=1 Tax=Cereibacter changlensis TaxID=402884 RepID=A0A4V6WLN3_9RHOB|nr:ParA family protein [Cereibacter changlensis]TKA94147.1 ParA family protein [Cereibacter changlensis]
MNVIAAYSHKGGTGKTTTLMMLANAIEAKGQRALLVDCDPQQNFAMYRDNSRTSDFDYWSDNMNVVYLDFEATTIVALESALIDADDSGKYDYALLNLAGADHPFNRMALRYAELTLLPFKPAATELAELSPALAVIDQLAESGEIGQVRVVFTMMKSSMTAAQNLYRSAAEQNFEVMKTEIKDNSVFADLVMRGLLARTIAGEEQSATGLRIMDIRRLKSALDDCVTLLAEVDQIIEGETA